MTIDTKTASMTIQEFSSWARLGRTKIYELIGSGELPAIKVGRRTYIRTAEAEAWLEACPHMLQRRGVLRPNKAAHELDGRALFW